MVPVEEESPQSSTGADEDLPPARALGHSPVSSIIRPQLWVHWTITLLCLVAWGGMIYLGDLAERTDFGLRDILGLRSGRVTNFFSTLMLLWAGQLSLLIYWYRRKSRNDFAGRYRMWLWIGGMLQLFLVVTATRAHRPFSQYMQRMWPLDIPMYDLFCWLVPVATLSVAMYRMLRIELKRHRSGKFLLTVAGIAAVIAAATLIVGPLMPVRARDLLEIGSATLAHLALATALLMHARYVVHISNEVPRRERVTRRAMTALRAAAAHLPLPRVRMPKFSARNSRRLTMSRLRLPRIGLPKLPALPKFALPKLPSVRLPKPTVATPKTGQSDDGKRVEQSPTKQAADPPKQATRPSKKQPSRPTASQASAAAVTTSGDSKSVQTRAVLTSRKKKKRRPDDQEVRRVDAAQEPRGPRRGPAPTRSLDDILDEYGADEQIDAETLRGLSKKQRRRLRKKQRELQRTGQ